MTNFKINKRRLLLCLIISALLSTYFYADESNLYNNLEHHGVKTIAYVKVAAQDLTFKQKLKYTFNPVDKYYFISTRGDTISGLRKSRHELKELKHLQFYLPLDSLIYDKSDPESYLFLSDYSYSPIYSGIMHLGFGFLFFTLWFYMLIYGVLKVRKRYQERHSVP